MTTLCLDLGTTTGWCIRNQNLYITSGSISFKNNRFEGGGMRYLRFIKWLEETHKLEEIKKIYFEEVRRHVGTDAAHAYGGFLASLTAWCESHKIPYSGIPVGTIKKYMTGKGNASKQAMIDKVTKIGFEPKDDNEADAISILYTALEL